MSANLEISAVVTGLEKVSFHSNPKEGQLHSKSTEVSLITGAEGKAKHTH